MRFLISAFDSIRIRPFRSSYVGVKYGTEWVIRHLIETRLEPVDGDEMFEELLDECYPEVTISPFLLFLCTPSLPPAQPDIFSVFSATFPLYLRPE